MPELRWLKDLSIGPYRFNNLSYLQPSFVSSRFFHRVCYRPAQNGSGRVDHKQLTQREYQFARECVQRRLVYSVGVSPTGVKVSAP